jgi:hypothetical protein
MASELLTPKFRGAFVAIMTPSTNKKDDGTTEKKYTIKAVFEPGADLSAMKAAAASVLAEKYGADQSKWPGTLRSPFRKNSTSDFDKPVAGMPEDCVVMSFSSKEDRRPGVVDADLNDIIDASKVYSGAYYRAQVRPFFYENKGNKGVSFALQNVQFLTDGEPLGGRIPANKVFDAVVAPSGASATSLFD